MFLRNVTLAAKSQSKTNIPYSKKQQQKKHQKQKLQNYCRHEFPFSQNFCCIYLFIYLYYFLFPMLLENLIEIVCLLLVFLFF